MESEIENEADVKEEKDEMFRYSINDWRAKQEKRIDFNSLMFCGRKWPQKNTEFNFDSYKQAN